MADNSNECIDLRGTRCPLTLLKMKQHLYGALSASATKPSGSLLSESASRSQTAVKIMTFLFDDPGAARDLPLYLDDASQWHATISENSGTFTAVCVESQK